MAMIISFTGYETNEYRDAFLDDLLRIIENIGGGREYSTHYVIHIGYGHISILTTNNTWRWFEDLLLFTRVIIIIVDAANIIIVDGCIYGGGGRGSSRSGRVIAQVCG